MMPETRVRRVPQARPASTATRVHPWRWLHVLRSGALAMIIVEGLLFLLVSYQAHREITTVAGDGKQAIDEVIQANDAIGLATAALQGITAKTAETISLSGPGSQYVNSYTSATKQLTLAALHNVAGPGSATDISFAGGLLVIYDGQVRQAITDYVEGHDTLGEIEVGYLPHLGVQAALTTVLQDEQQAATADLSSLWLRPDYVWWLLLAPFFVLLLTVVGTSYVLWHGFRRLLSVRLTAAAAVTLALVVFAAELNGYEGRRAHAFMTPALKASLGTGTPGAASLKASLAYSPLTLTLAVGLALAAVACALVYAACHPRLEEYRYRP
jgi:hypothetical protein